MDTEKQTNKKNTEQDAEPVGDDFFEHLWEKSWTYIKTVVDVVREPVLILDKHFHVIAANDPFYQMFQVEPKDTEGEIIYELGNGQWSIPDLKKLLENILPQNTFFRGFEVSHDFPVIGHKTMILNARQIHFKDNTTSELLPGIILLAIEDVTDMMVVAETLSGRTKQIEANFTEKAEKLEMYVEKLEKEINELKKKL